MEIVILKRQRPQEEEIDAHSPRTRYISDNELTKRYIFCVRAVHTKYLVGNSQEIISKNGLIKGSAFVSITLPARSYMNDVVLHQTRYEALMEFFENLIGPEKYRELKNKGVQSMDNTDNHQVSAEDSKINKRVRAIDLVNSGLPRKDVCMIMGLTNNCTNAEFTIKYLTTLIFRHFAK